MSDRDDILKDIGADIRKWTVGPNGISAEGDEDTNNLMRVLNAHPRLPEAFARHHDPEVEARMQMMLDIINGNVARNQTPSGAPGEAEAAAGLPPNPLRMSQAVAQYKVACSGKELVAKTLVEKEGLLTKLSAHVAASMPKSNGDPFVHDIGTHHLSTFIDAMSTKAATDGSGTDEAASPRTLIKKISSLRAFFDWAREERQATVADPAAGLSKREHALRKTASRTKKSYHPFNTDQLQSIFEPGQYLAFNNRADYFWTPLLGLHLGTRMKEIVTLELEHIGRHEETGIWFMDVVPENAKNDNSVRRLPIPTRLVELGFIDYVESLRSLGANQLFPHRDLSQPTVALDPSGNCTDRFAKYLDTLGIKDPALVFHSFRHTVVTALQDAGTPLSDSMQITGHQAQEHAILTGRLSAEQARSVHIKTYTHADKARLNTEFPLARLHRWLDRAIQVPLDYPRLRRAATIVREHVVKTRDGFTTGWKRNSREHREQLRRLNEA